MANTVEYIGRDFEELIDGIRVPELRTKLEGKHALVVARGYRHREDLHSPARLHQGVPAGAWSRSTAVPTRCSRPVTGRT